MKLFMKKTSLLFRLGVTFAALLLGQQAMAVGTPAGEVIDNTASVAYEVAAVAQTAVPSNTVSFVVDRRVSFTLDLVGAALVPITPVTTDAWFDLLLTNTSNSALDFRLVLDQAGVTTVRTLADTTDMVTPEYAASATFVSGSNDDPLQGGPQFVDDLPADDAIRIRVWGDAALTMLNGQIAGIQIDATAATPGAVGLGIDLVDTTDDDALVDNVFADAGNDGVEDQTDGFIVSAASVTVVKSFTIVGGGLPIPGEVIEYTIIVSNAAGAATAENIVVSDTIDDDLTFLLGAGGSAYTDIQVNDGGGPVECTADPAAGDTDGCSLDADLMVVGGALRDIDILGGGSYTVVFQTLIPDPAVTPPPTP